MRKIIELKYIIKIFISRWFTILSATVLCIGSSYIVGEYFMKSVYSASTDFLITNSISNDDSYNAIQSTLQLINT
ncbi:Wzz/FepE/Etk N-terminal domain-containing protein [Leuconostoc mesenteroides]|uniref:Wzz/FepE/Etk N-terminal domain-containing protein n=1 Tax=Leuconostoc mesenteroides TaxID=1245 RepID=UPI003340CF5B